MFSKYYREHAIFLDEYSRKTAELPQYENETKADLYDRKLYIIRSSISRAYYACFHMACTKLFEDGWIDLGRKNTTHTGVINCLHHVYHQNLIKLTQKNESSPADILDNLRRCREDSDYRQHLNKHEIYSLNGNSKKGTKAFLDNFMQIQNPNTKIEVTGRLKWNDGDLDQTINLLKENEIPYNPKFRNPTRIKRPLILS